VLAKRALRPTLGRGDFRVRCAARKCPARRRACSPDEAPPSAAGPVSRARTRTRRPAARSYFTGYARLHRRSALFQGWRTRGSCWNGAISRAATPADIAADLTAAFDSTADLRGSHQPSAV